MSKYICFLVAENPDYFKNIVFAPCDMKSCVTISIEDDLGVTTAQRVDIILGSADERIVLRQTNGDIEIYRISGMTKFLLIMFGADMHISLNSRTPKHSSYKHNKGQRVSNTN